ncbi:MAG: hypothetical protein M3321_10760, partial [Actinomycetota bacterium]|nr:hypothetical protein [Actinomycetota bacterium]
REAAAAPEPKAKPKDRPRPAPAPPPRRPSELDRLEAQIAEREGAIAELERKLADDWADVETLTAHRRARDELQSLIERWEALFESASH